MREPLQEESPPPSQNSFHVTHAGNKALSRAGWAFSNDLFFNTRAGLGLGRLDQYEESQKKELLRKRPPCLQKRAQRVVRLRDDNRLALLLLELLFDIGKQLRVLLRLMPPHFVLSRARKIFPRQRLGRTAAGEASVLLENPPLDRELIILSRGQDVTLGGLNDEIDRRLHYNLDVEFLGALLPGGSIEGSVKHPRCLAARARHGEYRHRRSGLGMGSAVVAQMPVAVALMRPQVLVVRLQENFLCSALSWAPRT